MTLQYIFLEAINRTGGISADWVLVGVTTVLGVIIVGMVRRVLNKLDDHEKRHNQNDVQHVTFSEQIRSGIEISTIINRDQDKKLDKIFDKLEAMTK